MIRSNSWITVVVDTVCRLLDMPSPTDPILPVWTPALGSPGPLDSLDSLDSLGSLSSGFRADIRLPADTRIDAAENGEGINVFVSIGGRE